MPFPRQVPKFRGDHSVSYERPPIERLSHQRNINEFRDEMRRMEGANRNHHATALQQVADTSKTSSQQEGYGNTSITAEAVIEENGNTSTTAQVILDDDNPDNQVEQTNFETPSRHQEGPGPSNLRRSARIAAREEG